MKRIFLIIALFTAFQTLNAQEIKKLKIDQLVKYIDTSSAPLVVNFFATWCGPCIREIPWFEKQVAAYNGKVRMILVSIDFAEDYPKTLQAFVKEKGFRMPVMWLNETNADIFCPKIDKSWEGAIPATLMVNNKKHYRQFYGQQLPEPQLLQALQKLTE